MPENLQPLVDISANFYWSWQPDGVALFRDLAPKRWEKCEQHPRTLLKTVSERQLWQRAADPGYVERVQRFKAKFENYLQSNDYRSQTLTRPTTDHPVAYFCAEYGVHNSLPNYSGGLGILAGDHLKSASDLGLPLVAVGLLYRYGYFRQRLSHEGWQEESYHDVFNSELAVSPVINTNGERELVCVNIRGRDVFAQAWLARIGRISLYLLDTNVPKNADVDRLITGHLYGGDTETRIVQEKVLGIGGVRLLRKLGVSPSVFHLNEGHSAFLTLELAREHINEYPGQTFGQASAAVRQQCVFTTHTPVAAGNDVFSPTQLRECFSEDYLSSLRLTFNEFVKFGRKAANDDSEGFGMTPLALHMCRSANGVSRKHGEVSRGLWKEMFPALEAEADVPITSVTNGVHAPTWVAPVFQSLYAGSFGSDWQKILLDPAAWQAAVASLSADDIWNNHLILKNLLITFIRDRTRTRDAGNEATIHEHEHTGKLFSTDVLTIGFARRVAAYKRWDLMFSDLPRLLRSVDNAERPVQFVFAGKAHPQDRTAKSILKELMSINNDSSWQDRAVFIEDYDQEVARYLVHGVDVWMNVPRRPMEASGTSGMKAAMNGVLNFSILDGWWIEGYNGHNGFAIGDLAGGLTDEQMDDLDAEFLYSTLENRLIPAFYATDASGRRTEWIEMMRNSIASLTPQFSSDRMVTEYLSRIYTTV